MRTKSGPVLNQRFVVQEIRERMRETGAHIVFLQEVAGENQRHAPTLAPCDFQAEVCVIGRFDLETFL
jgi:endonuclease/exonuclease/phosphatase family metal-dependent hydrolase